MELRKIFNEFHNKLIEQEENENMWIRVSTSILKNMNKFLNDEELIILPEYYDFAKLKSPLFVPSEYPDHSFVNITKKIYIFLLSKGKEKGLKKISTSMEDVTNSAGYVKDIQILSSHEIIDVDNNKKIKFIDFFKKPKGISILNFIEQKFSLYKELNLKRKNVLLSKNKTTERGIFYRASIEELKAGEIIKPVWTKEKLIQRGKVNLGSDLGMATEKKVEEYRPKGKPSRIESIFIFENIEDALNYESEKRNVYVVQPLKGAKTHRANLNLFTSIGTQIKEIAEVEDEDEDDPYLEEIKQDLVQMLNDYWAGNPGKRNNPVWETIVSSPGIKVIKKIEK